MLLSGAANLLPYVYRALVMLVAIPFHEAAHALVSDKLGDDTAKRNGRLTLNPLAHFDPLGAICMIVAGIGWAKPVPTNANRFKNPKAGMAITALAGPVANLLLAYVGMVLLKLGLLAGLNDYLLTLLYYLVILNVSLAVFNLLPIPPFDGSRIALTFLPRKWYFGVMKYERYIFLAMFALLFLGVFDPVLQTLNSAAFTLLDNGTRYIDLLGAVLGML